MPTKSEDATPLVIAFILFEAGIYGACYYWDVSRAVTNSIIVLTFGVLFAGLLFVAWRTRTDSKNSEIGETDGFESKKSNSD